MDGFNSREFYGHSLSEDPKLRTTTRNYEFKYNSSDYLEKIISRVRKDREKKKEMELLDCNNNGKIRFRNRSSKTDDSERQVMEMPIVETQIGICRSREAVVKVMSDEEIEEMISQAHQSIDNLSALKEIKNLKEFTPSKEPTKDGEIQKDEKLPQLSIEVFPNIQPQWVEIKPIQKSFASLIEVPFDSHHSDEDVTDYEDLSPDLNLGNENENPKTPETPRKENKLKTNNKDHYFDSLSLGSMITEDFRMRNPESDDDNVEDDSPPESLISLGIESSLNECEHLEMERVFENVFPKVPKMQIGSLESLGKSDSSDFTDEENEQDDTKTQDYGSFGGEAFDTLTIRKSPPNPTNTSSFASAQHLPPNTSRSIKNTRKVVKNPSLNKNTPRAQPTKDRSNVQIEDLKQEKLRIFSKMTSIQQKIIKSLDALRINLVEMTLPDGDVEKKLRERNALEFSVRFSRNYLFPLGKMMDDLRLSPKENYHSALTNEPCVKVCGIYGLLSEAIQCYQKQLRHFFTDSIPKKLDLLLHLIRDTTNICLEKQIFDTRDTLIQSLISRCEMFLEYVLEFAEKKKSARNEESGLQSERRSRFKMPKTSSKWDLTMNLNNLNMYEPKLVQKKSKNTLKKKPVKIDSHRGTSTTTRKKTKLIPRDSVDSIAIPTDDLVETQVRKDNTVDSVQLINEVITEEPDSELAKAVIETLQDITKDEVHQMFGPFVLNLDSILKSSDNPQIAVESVLNALKSKYQEAKGKQLKIDEIATENSTQNSNSYQKEVTKKGTHSNKSKQQNQQQFKETRQNKVSKTKAKAASCTSSKNVKEDSTEQTERYSRSELADTNTKTKTICSNKQSLRNIEVPAFVSENENVSIKQKTSSSGAFLSATAAAAKKPTSAPDTNGVGGIAAVAAPPPSTPLNILSAKLDDVMPPTLSRDTMTSEQCLDYSIETALPVGLPRADNFVTQNNKLIITEDRKHRKEDAASQLNVRDGAANANDGAEDTQEAWRKNLPAAVVAAAKASSPVRNEATKSGEMDKLYYRKNALYTFVKSLENSVPSKNQQNPNYINVSTKIQKQTRDITEKPTVDTLEAPIESKIDKSSCISKEKQANVERQNDIDIKALLEERNDFIQRCKNDPFYTNPQFPQPWKVLSKISKVIAREIVENFENDLSFGEESYIKDFIDMEIQT